MSEITVVINGSEREVPGGLTIDGLLEHLKIRAETAVVEHNRTILKAREHAAVVVEAGDTLEIVRFVGGG